MCTICDRIGGIMNEWGGWVCLSGICFGPIITFAFGVMIGSGKIRLPYRLVRNDDAGQKYAVEE